MKFMSQVIFLSVLSTATSGQIIQSGQYNSGLRLAYDSLTRNLTGYFESYTGYNEVSGNATFSCIFYFQGTVTDGRSKIDSYYPGETDTITGVFQIINARSAGLKLSAEHGGCWNVQHFADEPLILDLESPEPWTQVRYVMSEKAYFYSDPSLAKRQNSYLVKNDFVCIERIANGWAYCTYFGKAQAKGWLRTEDLNQL